VKDNVIDHICWPWMFVADCCSALSQQQPSSTC